MLPQLEAILRASPKITSFQTIDSDPLDEGNCLFFTELFLQDYTIRDISSLDPNISLVKSWRTRAMIRALKKGG
jgi:hypothetical protein